MRYFFPAFHFAHFARWATIGGSLLRVSAQFPMKAIALTEKYSSETGYVRG